MVLNIFYFSGADAGAGEVDGAEMVVFWFFSKGDEPMKTLGVF
jgi:hypothetical protein